jgi:2TM domain-containing protein
MSWRTPFLSFILIAIRPGRCDGWDSKGSSNAETNEIHAAAAQVQRTAAPRLAALNLLRNPAHPWFLWVLCAWGIAIAAHDVALLIKFRPKRSEEAQTGY